MIVTSLQNTDAVELLIIHMMLSSYYLPMCVCSN